MTDLKTIEQFNEDFKKKGRPIKIRAGDFVGRLPKEKNMKVK